MASNDVPMADAAAQTIDAAPQAGQHISHEGKEYTTIKEGLAHILVPHGVPTSTDPKLSKEETQKQQVFYNPIQQFNRDLSVLAIKTFGEDSIRRKLNKHEQFRKKNERKRQRAQASRAAGDAAEPVDEAPETSGAEDEATRKRKLAELELENTAGPSKKQKTAPDGSEEEVESGEKTSWKPPFSILDALSATGLRALRYAKEIPFATAITANDMSPKAVESIKLNVKHNKLEDTITANTGNAIAYMYSFCDRKGYDVIDLDPYGTAAPFIDAAIQAVNDDGLLCVTCTDSAIFASHGYLEKTYSQYGGLPFKGEPCHEGGLRLILHAIASSAARYGMAIEPLLSLSIDYYIRVFVRVRKAPNDVKLLAGKTMLVYHCESGCVLPRSPNLLQRKMSVFRPSAHALITGGASGIGYAVARLCLSHSMRVTITDTNQTLLDQATKSLSGNLTSIKADVTSRSDWATLKQHIGTDIDFLMLNAGIGGKGTWGDADYFDSILGTNLGGVVNGLNAFVPVMLEKEKEGGKKAIVITGSKQGITNPPGNAAYNASKAAVKTLAEHLSFDLKDTNVGVHLLVPGWTFTGLAGKVPGSDTETPKGAWSADQVAEYMLEKMKDDKFYIICPDGQVTEETDKKRMLWSVGDIIGGRPPLTRWRPEYKEEAEKWMAEQKV